MKTTLLLLVIAFTNLANASEQFDIDKHQLVVNYYNSLRAHAPLVAPSSVLVVYDIDNTTLAMDRNFGSDQWFNWQVKELSAQSDLSLAKNFGGLLSIQYQSHFFD